MWCRGIEYGPTGGGRDKLDKPAKGYQSRENLFSGDDALRRCCFRHLPSTLSFPFTSTTPLCCRATGLQSSSHWICLDIKSRRGRRALRLRVRPGVVSLSLLVICLCLCYFYFLCLAFIFSTFSFSFGRRRFPSPFHRRRRQGSRQPRKKHELQTHTETERDGERWREGKGGGRGGEWRRDGWREGKRECGSEGVMERVRMCV